MRNGTPNSNPEAAALLVADEGAEDPEVEAGARADTEELLLFEKLFERPTKIGEVVTAVLLSRAVESLLPGAALEDASKKNPLSLFVAAAATLGAETSPAIKTESGFGTAEIVSRHIREPPYELSVAADTGCCCKA